MKRYRIGLALLISLATTANGCGTADSNAGATSDRNSKTIGTIDNDRVFAMLGFKQKMVRPPSRFAHGPIPVVLSLWLAVARHGSDDGVPRP